MFTAHANSGIDALHTALTAADTQLERISTRLQSELSLNHTKAQTNPFILLQRLRNLQRSLPALREQLFTIHQQKAQLVVQCRTDLAQNTAFARRILPIAAPVPSDPASLDQELTKAQNDLTAMLNEFRTVNAGFLERSDIADYQVNLSLLRALADVNREGPEVEKKPSEETGQPENSVEEIPMNNPVNANAKTQRTTVGGKKTVPGSKKTVTVKDVKETKREFVPVSKVVYNRLPRVLKIKAGKLPQVNEFYEKVFNVLCERSGPLSDAKLKNATGESDMTKFEVLRGLAVLRHTKQGWVLAG